MKLGSCLIVIVATSILALVSNAQVNTVTSNNLHVVTYEVKGDNVIFVLESIADFTDGREKKDKRGMMDFAGLSVDRDDNGVIDSGRDVDFGVGLGTTALCTSVLYTAESISLCGKFLSKAELKTDFRRTSNEARPHAVVEYTIPKKEISPEGKAVGIVYRFYAQDQKTVFYPEKEKDEPYFSFRKTLRLQL